MDVFFFIYFVCLRLKVHYSYLVSSPAPGWPHDPGSRFKRRSPQQKKKEGIDGVNEMDYVPIASGGRIARLLRPAGEYGDRLT
jgi:hypothetical protein